MFANSEHILVFEMSVTLLYGICKNNISTVVAARYYLFLHKEKEFLHMPPGSDALYQHLVRVAYQNGHVWESMLNQGIEPVPVTDWGWQQESPI